MIMMNRETFQFIFRSAAVFIRFHARGLTKQKFTTDGLNSVHLRNQPSTVFQN